MHIATALGSRRGCTPRWANWGRQPAEWAREHGGRPGSARGAIRPAAHGPPLAWGRRVTLDLHDRPPLPVRALQQQVGTLGLHEPPRGRYHPHLPASRRSEEGLADDRSGPLAIRTAFDRGRIVGRVSARSLCTTLSSAPHIYCTRSFGGRPRPAAGPPKCRHRCRGSCRAARGSALLFPRPPQRASRPRHPPHHDGGGHPGEGSVRRAAPLG